MNRIKGYEIIPNLRREEGIKFAAFNISTSCPYKCKYCFVGDIKLKNSLSNKRWKEILDFFLNFSDVETYIFAGTKEPFARKKLLYYLVKKITQANKWAVIYTNLYLIKREELRQLKNMNISLIVKCDSLERDTYEFLVGKKNSFEKFIKNLEYVVELFPENRIGINFQLTKLNLGEMEKVREFFRKRNIEINYRILVKEGYAEKNWDILVGDKYFLLLKYAEKNKIVGRTITSYGKCAFLHHGIVVDYNGDILPACPVLRKPLFNIRDISLNDLIRTYHEKKKEVINPEWRCVKEYFQRLANF